MEVLGIIGFVLLVVLAICNSIGLRIYAKEMDFKMMPSTPLISLSFVIGVIIIPTFEISMNFSWLFMGLGFLMPFIGLLLLTIPVINGVLSLMSAIYMSIIFIGIKK